MHKSKNYDMATEVAMDKLMPKPIQITISMQGGGGLTGLGERPISSVYGRPIPRTIYRVSGGEIDPEGNVIAGGYGDYEAGVQQESSDDKSWFHDPAYGKTGQGTTVKEKQHLRHTGADTRPAGPPSSRMYKDWRNPNILYDRYERDAVGRNKVYDSTYGGMSTPQGLNMFPTLQQDPIIGQGYRGKAGSLTTTSSNWLPISEKEAKYMTGVRRDISGQPHVTKETLNFMGIKDEEPYPDMLEEPLDDSEIMKETMERIKDEELREEFIKNPNLYLMNRSAKGGKVMPGGLSGINKPININGQPHKLAWINPGEASALKAMGGSGKPGPMGIPSYQETDTYSTQFDDYVAEDLADTVGPDEDGYSWDWGPTGGYDYATDKRAEGPEETGYSDQEIRDYALRLSPDEGRYTSESTALRNLGPIGTKRATAEHHDQLTDMRKGILGLYGDRMNRGEALEGAKRSAFTTWRNTVGKYSLDTPKDYDEWFAKQDPNALIAGYKVGDPVGHAMQSSFDIVNKQLKKKFKDARDDKAVTLDDDEEFEMTREELGEIVESAKVEGLEDFTPYSGMSLPGWVPGGGWISGIGNFLSRTVIGTGTVGGVGVHLHKDGSVTPVSPEDSPGYDHESMKGENVEPIDRRKQRGGFGYTQEDVEKLQEEPLTGMSGLLAKRGPTDKSAGTKRLEELLASLYPKKDFNIG